MRQNLISDKPWIPFLLTCVIIALIAWMRREILADLQLKDTYLVVGIPFLAGTCGTIMAVSSLLYWLTRSRTGLRQLTAAHVLGTIGLSIYLVSAMGTSPAADAARTVSPQEFQTWQEANQRFAVTLLVLFSLQLIFIANLIYKGVKG